MTYFYRDGVYIAEEHAPLYDIRIVGGTPKKVPASPKWVQCAEPRLPKEREVPCLGVMNGLPFWFYLPPISSAESIEALRTSWIVQKIRALYSVDDELKLTNEALQATLSGETPSEAYIAYRNAVSTIKAESVSYKNSLILAEQQRLADWEEAHKDVDFSEEAVQRAIDAIPVPPPIPEPEPEPIINPPPHPFFIPSV